jgi:hypothetical protein
MKNVSSILDISIILWYQDKKEERKYNAISESQLM